MGSLDDSGRDWSVILCCCLKLTDLSDLSAQTDAFARGQRPLTGREALNSGASNASSPTTESQSYRLSSYSSVVSSVARSSSSDQLPPPVVGTAKPSVTSISSASAVDVGYRSSAGSSATGDFSAHFFTFSLLLRWVVPRKSPSC